MLLNPGTRTKTKYVFLIISHVTGMVKEEKTCVEGGHLDPHVPSGLLENTEFRAEVWNGDTKPGTISL